MKDTNLLVTVTDDENFLLYGNVTTWFVSLSHKFLCHLMAPSCTECGQTRVPQNKSNL